MPRRHIHTGGKPSQQFLSRLYFDGGLNVTGTGSNPTVTMGAGQYVFAGNAPGPETQLMAAQAVPTTSSRPRTSRLQGLVRAAALRTRAR